jgi:hypothetical protein
MMPGKGETVAAYFDGWLGLRIEMAIVGRSCARIMF